MTQSYMMLNAKTIEGMMDKYNPFALTDADGEALGFSDYGKVYEWVFKQLYEDFKCGLVDLPLFLDNHTNMKLRDCRTMMKRLWWRDETVKVDWRLRPEVSKFLLDFITFMHKMTKTQIDEDMLLAELRKFLNSVNV